MEKLAELRAEIEQIDKDLANLIAKRMETSLKIGQFKKENNLSVYDPKREEELKEKNLSLVEEKFRSGYMEIFETILKVSKDMQL